MSRETLRGTNRQAREINNESRGFGTLTAAMVASTTISISGGSGTSEDIYIIK